MPTSLSTCTGNLVCVCECKTFGGMTYVVLQHVSVYDVFLCVAQP